MADFNTKTNERLTIVETKVVKLEKDVGELQQVTKLHQNALTTITGLEDLASPDLVSFAKRITPFGPEQVVNLTAVAKSANSIILASEDHKNLKFPQTINAKDHPSIDETMAITLLKPEKPKIPMREWFVKVYYDAGHGTGLDGSTQSYGQWLNSAARAGGCDLIGEIRAFSGDWNAKQSQGKEASTAHNAGIMFDYLKNCYDQGKPEKTFLIDQFSNIMQQYEGFPQ